MKYKFILSTLLFFAVFSTGIYARQSVFESSFSVLSPGMIDLKFFALLFFSAAAAILLIFNIGGSQNGS